mgnify:CR=1 FL=1|tara:strand:+ start:387 stop:812 length:426 start_codon:yes stop_codon:yes gene_type:complete
MFKIFKKTKNYNYDEQIISKIASLLIHAAKIDENYTTEENNIIKKTLIELGANRDKVNSIISTAEQNEKNSNQMLDFTKEIKNLEEKKKEKIVECLWTIIYSDAESDMFESNLMRRLSGLLYLDKKTVGDIKEKVKNRIIK